MFNTKLRYAWNQKDWYRNIANIVINYRHKSEGNVMYTVHMDNKCRIDRMCCDSKIWRWK